MATSKSLYSGAAARRIAWWSLFLMISFPACLSAQNLIVNSTFDNDLTGWENQFTHVDAYWGMDDALGDPHSGSVNINKSGDNGAEIIVFQCVPVEPDTEYSFGADFKLFTTDVATYTATLILYPKSNSNCGGAAVGAAAVTNVSVTGSWITTSTTITTPATGGWIDFRVIANNPVNESVHIAADNIWLIPNDIFVDMVFDDGFE